MCKQRIYKEQIEKTKLSIFFGIGKVDILIKEQNKAMIFFSMNG